jgi:hypothetical protein
MIKMNRQYIPGDRWVRCDECSFGYRYSQIRKGVSLRQKGFHVCPDCFDTRHPNTDWRLSPKQEGRLIGGNIGSAEGIAGRATVTTQAVVPVGSESTATGNGTIINLGSPTATQHGVCWSSSSMPTISDSKSESGVPLFGAFTTDIIGLTGGIYDVRAYVTNTAGTVYGAEVSFTSLNTGDVTFQGDSVTWQGDSDVTW